LASVIAACFAASVYEFASDTAPSAYCWTVLPPMVLRADRLKSPVSISQ